MIAVGCSPPEPRSSASATYDPATGALTRVTYDSNANGTRDSVAYMDGTRVLRIEIDTDEDGRPDRWEYYDDRRALVKVGRSTVDDGRPDEWAYQAPDGSIARMDYSSHGHDAVARSEYYVGGAIARAEVDGDGDGKVDQWESYDRGHVVSIALDTRHQGKPDRRLVYGVDGEVAVVEVDRDGNGTWQNLLDLGDSRER